MEGVSAPGHWRDTPLRPASARVGLREHGALEDPVINRVATACDEQQRSPWPAVGIVDKTFAVLIKRNQNLEHWAGACPKLVRGTRP